MFLLSDSDGNVIKNNTFTDSRYGISLATSSNNVVSDNTIIKDLNFDKRGIRLDGSSTNNQIINNTVSGYENGLECRSDSNYFSGNVFDDNLYGILFRQGSEYNKFENNTIKNNEYYGIFIQDASKSNEFWNNTISSSNEYDFYIEDNSSGHFVVNTPFSTIYVESGSDILILKYLFLDVNDARGENISGIDIKIKEEDSVKYSTEYFGGSDSKTDANGTIAPFLINYKKYDGSSTPTVIPTSVSARSNDWVETSTFDPSNTINITVPDLRVLNTRTDVLTYNIQTAIDNAEEGDTIHAWNGTYYENIEISD
ncbi:uncharacterized protein METZ01_LOCUS353865, partial [marine metagenome]